MQMDRATELAHLKMYGALRPHYDVYGTGPKIGSVKLPNFKANNEMYTKTTSTRSDEEILKALAELAKKHAEMAKEPENIKKKYDFFQNADNEYLDLFKEYISSVSPDREGILKNSLQEIFKKASMPKKEDTLNMKDSSNKSVLQQTLKLMEQMKNKNGTNKTAWRSGEISGSMYKVGSMEGNDLQYADFFNSNGEMIAHYDQNGWKQFFTKEEETRWREALATYNEAYISVYKAPEASLPKSVDVGNSFDVVG